MDERELIARLEEAAGAGSGQAVRDDLADVELRAGRVRTRRRWATGVAAAMLVAGAGGVGFGLGRSIDDQPAGEAIAPAGTAPSEPTAPAPVTSVEPPATAPEVAATPATDAPAATTPPVEAPAAPRGSGAPPAPGDVAVSVEDTAAGMQVPEMPQPMTLLDARQLADGTRVRTQLGQRWEMGDMGYPGGFQPALWCYPDQELRITVDGPEIVDVTSTSVYSELGAAPLELVGQRSELGYADGRPMRVLFVQSSAGDTTATVRWDDGVTDTAEFTEGLVVLLADGSNSWEHTYELDVTGPEGTRTLTNAEIEDVYSTPEWRAGCEPPPPSLPEAGEQPADPTAAEEALRADFAALWDRAIPREDKQHLVDDWTGVGEAIDAVDAGTYADAAASAVHTIDELVFTSPTDAWFRYSITTDVSDFHDRYGRATLVDGSWQFPRGMMCQDLQLAGAMCVPPAAPIYPPSWYEINGSAWYGGCDANGNCIDCQVFADGSEECTEHTATDGGMVSELTPATEPPVGP